jgi:hypothetical protein
MLHGVRDLNMVKKCTTIPKLTWRRTFALSISSLWTCSFPSSAFRFRFICCRTTVCSTFDNLAGDTCTLPPLGPFGRKFWQLRPKVLLSIHGSPTTARKAKCSHTFLWTLTAISNTQTFQFLSRSSGREAT